MLKPLTGKLLFLGGDGRQEDLTGRPFLVPPEDRAEASAAPSNPASEIQMTKHCNLKSYL